jgi:hypothetical protein
LLGVESGSTAIMEMIDVEETPDSANVFFYIPLLQQNN